jgi:protein-S-isoprenylcysteine O-methyltransferase Ste14
MQDGTTTMMMADPARSAADQRPRSAVSHGVGLAGLAGLLAWFLLARNFQMNGINSAYASVIACGVPMVLWSVLVDKVHLNASTGIDWSRARSRHGGLMLALWCATGAAMLGGDYLFAWSQGKELALWGGIAALAFLPVIYAFTMDSCEDAAERLAISRVKLVGLWATWAIIGFAYCVLRYYWLEPYLTAITMIGWLAIPLVLLSIPYVVMLDRRLHDPKDGCWAFGQWLLGQETDAAQRESIFAHLRTWAVKGFFTAFMVSIVPGIFIDILLRPMDVVLSNPMEFAAFLISFCYIIDVHLATVGYTLTMRPLDAHIREANPYGMAWVAALMCYPPFILMIGDRPLNYEVNIIGWGSWLGGSEALAWLWAGLLIALTAIYAWATAAFGIRFSNLTHRGILTHGPYAWTRHPAYISKNTFWWLSSLPMLSMTVTDSIRNTMLLAIISGIYYWRAKTEEKQLLADPAYRDYWNWAQQHALIPRLFRRFNGMDRPVIVLEPDPARPSPEKYPHSGD